MMSCCLRSVTAKRWRIYSLAPWGCLALCSCGPNITASKDQFVGRLVTISNADRDSILVQRIIANGSPDNSGCNAYPDKQLAPHETYTTTFILCGSVNKIQVDTDKGVAFPSLNTQ